MNITLESLGFKKSIDRLEDERLGRYEIRQNLLFTGIKFIDDVMGGFTKYDFVLIGAPTGSGKTSLLTTMADNFSKQGKKVAAFWLEAEPNEMERRRIWSRVCKQLPSGSNYRDYVLGKYNELIDEMLFDKSGMDNLFTYYRGSKFTLENYEKIYPVLAEQTDVTILDHLHYFDTETSNENKEMTEIVKAMRDLSLLKGRPAFVAAQFRKTNRFEKSLVASIEDFAGTSNIGKVCTAAFTLQSKPTESATEFITYCHVAKCRRNGGAQGLVGKMVYDTETESYLDHYKVGRINPDTQAWQELTASQWPSWLKKQ